MYDVTQPVRARFAPHQSWNFPQPEIASALCSVCHASRLGTSTHAQLSIANVKHWIESIEQHADEGVVKARAASRPVVHQRPADHCSCPQPTAAQLRPAPTSISAQILVGNKCDDEANRKIPTARGAELAAEYGMKFFETSAKVRSPFLRNDGRCSSPHPLLMSVQILSRRSADCILFCALMLCKEC